MWRVWAVIQPALDLLRLFLFEPLGWSGQFPDDEPVSSAELFVTNAIGVALNAPIWVALLRYGYRSETLWSRGEPSA